MYLHKSTFRDIRGDVRKQKAVSLAICMKLALGRNSRIHNYNPNKVQVLTKVNGNTFRKYKALMIEMGLIRFEGKNSEHLVVCRLHSSHKERNIDIHRFCFKSFTEVYRSLRAFLVILIQKRKDFVRHILQILHNPHSYDEFMRARKTVKRLVRQGVIKSKDRKAKDYGISYKRMAKETGNCERTAQSIAWYAVKKRWWRKYSHFNWTFLRNVRGMELDGYTFTTKNYGFVVEANTYVLSSGISKCADGMVSY